MAQIECGRGHLYDPDKYPTCPYCKTNQQITVAAAGRTAPVRTTAVNPTAPVPGDGAPAHGAAVPDAGDGAPENPAAQGLHSGHG